MREKWLKKWMETLEFEKDPVRFIGLLDCMKDDLVKALRDAGDQLLVDKTADEKKREGVA